MHLSEEFINFISRNNDENNLKDLLQDIKDENDGIFRPITIELSNRFLNLTELNLNNNQITKVPDEISILKQLQYLNLSYNLILSLPESIKDLSITKLNLNFNNLRDVPNVFFTGLKYLKTLILSHNSLVEFNKTPKCINNLRHLDLSDNSLVSLPPWIFHHDGLLEVVDLDNNFNLKTINYKQTGKLLGSLRTIWALSVRNCHLSESSLLFLSNIKKLTVFNFGNHAGELQNSFCKNDSHLFKIKTLPYLLSLDLRDLALPDVPSSLLVLKQLKNLNLSFNDLTWLPDAFCELVSLETCNLSNNKLALLPKKISKLVSLKNLSLCNNFLTSLPEDMYNLPKLQYLDLNHNSLFEVPNQLFSIKTLKGVDFEENYLNENDICQSYKKYKDSFRLHYQCTMRLDGQCLNDESCFGKSDRGLPDYYSEFEEDTNLTEETISDVSLQNDCHVIDLEEPCEEVHEPLVDTAELDDNWSPCDFLHRIIGDPLENNFCPADVHKSSLSVVMYEKKQNAILLRRIKGNVDVEDGQFDLDL